MTRRNRVTHICKVCGKEFETIAARPNAKYCSKECWNKRHPPETKNCAECGKSFTTFHREQITCSKKCGNAHRARIYVGEKATRWKGGKSLKRERGKASGKLQAWRKAVYMRDHYTCQMCGAKKNIHAHHIHGFADFEDERFDVSNGITVCIQCHEIIHGRKLSTPGKYPKHCVDCGTKTTGKSLRCRKCSSAYGHKMRVSKNQKVCPQCGKEFIKNADSKYCSSECAHKAITKLVEVQCGQCGKTVLKRPDIIKKFRIVFCSIKCKNSHQRTQIETECPVCHKRFMVEPNRIKNGAIPTCGRKCGRKQIVNRFKIRKQQHQLTLFD